jgi:hypothetical protein
MGPPEHRTPEKREADAKGRERRQETAAALGK